MSGVFVPVNRFHLHRDFAWVDEVDAERVGAYSWSVNGIHAVSGRRLTSDVPRVKSVAMHRFILGLAPGESVVHHVNEDPLDNRRANLKVVADKIAHGAEDHPRRDLVCRRLSVPPHERQMIVAAEIGVASRSLPARVAA